MTNKYNSTQGIMEEVKSEKPSFEAEDGSGQIQKQILDECQSALKKERNNP